MDGFGFPVDVSDFDKALKQGPVGHSIFNLSIDSGSVQRKKAMITEVQRHPVSDRFIHIDFYEIDMDSAITVQVPVETTGKAIGEENGGILQIVRRELDVICLPGDIPEKIELDITDLDIGDAIHVEEIFLGENIEIPADVNFTVVTVLSPKGTMGAEAAELEEEEAAELAELEEGEEEMEEGEEEEASGEEPTEDSE